MKNRTAEDRAALALSYLPESIREEIYHLASGRIGGLSEIREIRIRAGGRCSLVYRNESVPLFQSVGREQMDGLLYRLCEGSLYAHRDNIASGYIPLDLGIRVGVCGMARYEQKKVVGISELTSAVFRIPGHSCEFREELLAVWESGVGAGMLIFSPPGVGKTTALRALVAYVGSGANPKRVAVVDERCEFSPEDYQGTEVDILRGYKKRDGIEIAVRTMSPQVLCVDEVSGDDASSIAGVVRSGVPILATAHAASGEELFSKSSLSPLFECGAFDVFVGIGRENGTYSLSVNRI